MGPLSQEWGFPTSLLAHAEAEDPIPHGLTGDVEDYLVHPFVIPRCHPQPQMTIVLGIYRVNVEGAVGFVVSQELYPSLRGGCLKLFLFIEDCPIEILGYAVPLIILIHSQVIQDFSIPRDCVAAGNPDAGPLPGVEGFRVFKLPIL